MKTAGRRLYTNRLRPHPPLVWTVRGFGIPSRRFNTRRLAIDEQPVGRLRLVSAPSLVAVLRRG